MTSFFEQRHQSALEMELVLFRQLLVRYRNAHRRAKYYQYLQMVDKCVRKHALPDLYGALCNFRADLDRWARKAKRAQQEWTLQSSSSNDPLQKDRKRLGQQTLGIQEYLQRAQKAARYIQMELARGYFVSFLMTAAACVARIQSLLLKLVREVEMVMSLPFDVSSSIAAAAVVSSSSTPSRSQRTERTLQALGLLLPPHMDAASLSRQETTSDTASAEPRAVDNETETRTMPLKLNDATNSKLQEEPEDFGQSMHDTAEDDTSGVATLPHSLDQNEAFVERFQAESKRRENKKKKATKKKKKKRKENDFFDELFGK